MPGFSVKTVTALLVYLYADVLNVNMTDEEDKQLLELAYKYDLQRLASLAQGARQYTYYISLTGFIQAMWENYQKPPLRVTSSLHSTIQNALLSLILPSMSKVDHD